MKLSDVEHAALLKCRYAGRYDTLRDPNRVPATPKEAAEEQAAANTPVGYTVFKRLERLGLITSPRFRLTKAGHDASRARESGTMTEDEERAYDIGRRSAYRGIIATALRELGYAGRTLESLVVERETAVSALRSLCSEHGDNEWPDDLHLADVIEKHLGRHLEEKR